MTETIATLPEIPTDPAPQKAAVKGKIPSSVAFLIGTVLFFLPFIDIKCNNMSLQQLTGAELATGYNIKAPGSDKTLFDGLDKAQNDTGMTVSGSKDKDPNIYALAALALGGLGLILSFTHIKAAGIGGVLAGSLAAVSLIGLLIDIRRQLKAEMNVDGLNAGVSIAVDFTPWFYISVIAFIAAAYFSYLRIKR